MSFAEGLERMFLVTERNHPEHATYKWTKTECEWINDRIRTAMAAEREACAMVCEEAPIKTARQDVREACAAAIRERSNVEFSGRERPLCERSA